MLFMTALLALSGVEGAQDVENDPRFHELLLSAAKAHETYGRVDDVLRFAPYMCMAPPAQPVRASASKDEGTHGQKLYYLFAWDAAAYLKESRPDHYKARTQPPTYANKPAEQVLIKQSWTCVATEKEARSEPAKPHPYLRKDGKLFTTGEKKDLFLMVKLAEKTDGTDRGWVYGTVSPDVKTVGSSGRVQSCMACHHTAGDGRLFGLPKAK